jgi:ABC-type dipeptide/oligopeptide/nickel transport system ATPase subunit
MRKALGILLPCTKEWEVFMSLLQMPYESKFDTVRKPLDLRVSSNSVVVYTVLGAVPFEFTGGSFTRYAWYVASILSKSPKYIFIDNIETGLHWRFFKPLVRFLVGYCETNNAQVFASTHSYEVIEALSDALVNQNNKFLNVTHLRTKEDDIDCYQDSFDDLCLFVKSGVEIR